MSLRDNEIDECLAFEPSVPHIVASPFYDFEGYGAAQFFVASGEFGRVLFDGDGGIGVAVDVEDGYIRLRERLEVVDGIVVCKLLLELEFGEAVGGGGDMESGVATEVADGVDSGDAGDFFGTSGGPVVEHETTAASGEEACFGCEAAVFDEVVV